MNDACVPLMKMHYWIWNNSINVILKNVREIISRYQLSKDNKEGFLRLRHDYNEGILRNEPALFCLIMHAFNYSLHLNNAGEFNAPSGAGRSYFNPSLENKLVQAHKEIEKYMEDINTNVQFYNMDFEKVYRTTGNNVYFVDPPYSATISKQPYRVGGLRWTEDHDRRLFALLDSINARGDLFVFTNCMVNNGVHNLPLENWAPKYTLHPVRVDYTNSSYQRKNAGETQEVIITNF
jgi:site-specific DNA-adenine methylase